MVFYREKIEAADNTMDDELQVEIWKSALFLKKKAPFLKIYKVNQF